VAIYLIRHAKAGSRSAWTESDSTRPLDDSGLRQSAAIAQHWGHAAPIAVFSSPRLRCVQTVTPLADRFGMEVQVEPDIEEDTPFERALRVVEDAADGTVFCSHGDVIPDVIDALIRRGMNVNGMSGALRKGAMFVLHRENGRFVTADYVAPPRD
jgi:8-oxo-dGTP diphosphatase